MKGKIIKRVLIDKKGEEFIAYPATITEAIVDVRTKKKLSVILEGFPSIPISDTEIKKIL